MFLTKILFYRMDHTICIVCNIAQNICIQKWRRYQSNIEFSIKKTSKSHLLKNN